MGRQLTIALTVVLAFVGLKEAQGQNATCIATALGELASSALLNTTARHDAYRDTLLQYSSCLGVALSGKVVELRHLFYHRTYMMQLCGSAKTARSLLKQKR
jgi:hypothetical protein